MKRTLRITIACLAALTISCAASTRDKWIEILFDDPPSAAPDVAVDSTGTPPGETPSVSPAQQAAPPTVFLHSPYEDRECGDCHALSASKSFSNAARGVKPDRKHRRSYASRLQARKDKLCYECHDDMTPEALLEEGEVLHSPVEDGECLECHDPHKSRFASLLLRGDPFENLCLECHDAEDFNDTKPHNRLEGEDRTCTRCHDPHVSKREYLLKPKVENE